MNVRIFWVPAMECMYAQTRPQFKLSSERVLGNGVRNHVNPKGKDPLYQKALRRVKRWITSPTHYRLSYSSPVRHTNAREFSTVRRTIPTTLTLSHFHIPIFPYLCVPVISVQFPWSVGSRCTPCCLQTPTQSTETKSTQSYFIRNILLT